MRDPVIHERILVVDDEESIREVVCAMLGAAGYRCTPAASGNAALDLLASGAQFELMLSDLMMAEMQGDVLLERAKQKFPDMPVIMVTAVSDLSVALDAIRNGAYDYLTKPFDREQLLDRVRRALENRRLRLENLAFQMHLEALVAEQTAQLREINADLRRANDELKRSHDMMLEALGDALDLKDAETEGHCQRVTAFTITIQPPLRVVANFTPTQSVAVQGRKYGMAPEAPLVFTAQGGFPFTPQVGSNISGTGDTNIPDVPNWNPNFKGPVVTGNPDQWFNPRAFLMPTPDTFGDVSRGALIGPGLVDIDTSFFKKFTVTERVSVQLRAEAFNILNHANFFYPNAIVFQGSSYSPTAGQIVAAGQQRELQLALKLIF